MNFQTTRTEIEELFSEVGQVVDVFMLMDRATGRPRGMAFVELATSSEAEAAIEKFNGYELGGRELRVNEATERPGGSGGFGGGRSFGSPGGGGGGGRPKGGVSRPKGSRRGLRAKKRSL